MVWAECKQLWEEVSKRTMFRHGWNWVGLHHVIVFLATSTESCCLFSNHSSLYGSMDVWRASLARQQIHLNSLKEYLQWQILVLPNHLPIQTRSSHLGPLQISLGCMIVDIAKFFFSFTDSDIICGALRSTLSASQTTWKRARSSKWEDATSLSGSCIKTVNHSRRNYVFYTKNVVCDVQYILRQKETLIE
ncbi:hypothetical protein AVEN_169885-1 [Araneus ventricosus]|uniref:Uncharacterized protein n=1 Tax=Araneus ventricosus TaxID=182803 RepID=A0A4Y2IK90_ARAVE|nr:hypothetical protein AVEN_169885-1 [Araneus ventricosus]